MASDYCGILRCGDGLREAIRRLDAVPRSEAPLLTRAQSELRNVHALAVEGTFDDCQRLAAEQSVPLKQVMAAAGAAYLEQNEKATGA